MNRGFMAATLFAAIAAAGCAKEESKPFEIAISPTISRVSGTNFDVGDQIGLTISSNSTTHIHNTQLTYNGSSFVAAGILWYNDLNQTSTLTAYHPYNPSAQPAEFSIATDQSAGCGSSDLLVSTKSDVKPSASPVKMIFRHLLSQLTILVTNNSQGAVSTVTIGGFIPSATVDYTLAKATVKTNGTAANIECFTVADNSSFRAILVPQQGQLTVTVTTNDGKSHSKTLSAVQLDGGKQYDMSLTVTDIDINLVLSGEIEDWGQGGSIDQDSGDSGGGGSGETPTDQPIVYQGVTYATKSFGGTRWMAENLRYIPSQELLGKGIWYPSLNSTSNSDPSYVAARGMLYTYAAATSSAPLSRTGAIVRGICPEGWHIPTIAQFTALFSGGYDINGFFTIAGYWIGERKGYGEEKKSFMLTTEIAADSQLLNAVVVTTGATQAISIQNGVSLRCVEDKI